jgi:hypothetical protein
MKLTRSDLLMMLEEMDNNNADYIKLDVYIYGSDYTLDSVDFDMYNSNKYINTVLTLE